MLLFSGGRQDFTPESTTGVFLLTSHLRHCYLKLDHHMDVPTKQDHDDTLINAFLFQAMTPLPMWAPVDAKKEQF